MRKSAEEIAEQVIEDPGARAVRNKTKERWIAALVSGGLGTGAGLLRGRIPMRELPGEILGGIGLGGLVSANLPNKIWKDPVENADDPRWWKEDYSPTRYGVGLGVGSGLGSMLGGEVVGALQRHGVFKDLGRTPKFKDALLQGLGKGGIIAAPAVAGFLAARHLLRRADEK